MCRLPRQPIGSARLTTNTLGFCSICHVHCRRYKSYKKVTDSTFKETPQYLPLLLKKGKNMHRLTQRCGRRCPALRRRVWWSRGPWSGKNIYTLLQTPGLQKHEPTCTHTQHTPNDVFTHSTNIIRCSRLCSVCTLTLTVIGVQLFFLSNFYFQASDLFKNMYTICFLHLKKHAFCLKECKGCNVILTVLPNFHGL